MKNKIKKKDIIVFSILLIIFITGITLIYISDHTNNDENNKVVTEKINYYISLIGNEKITIYKDDEFIDPGYKASNNLGADLTSSVVTTGEVDTSVIGEYDITYRLGDTIKTRKVIVVERPVDHTYIHLLGNRIIYLNVGDAYVEPGYKVYDSINSGLSNNDVKITSNVNINKGGIYKIIYEVVNSRGVTTSAIRTVIVMDSNIILSLDNTNYTNKEVTINIYINDIYFDYLLLPDGTRINTNTYSYKVKENGNYTFKVFNKMGSSKVQSITVNNINKTNPSGNCSGSYRSGVSTININATDDIGISKYVINNKSYSTNKITISGEYKQVTVTLYDKASNTSNISCNLTNDNPKVEIPIERPQESQQEHPYEPTTKPKAIKNIIIGDSRTVGMCTAMTWDSYYCNYDNGGKESGNDYYIAKVSTGYSWFNNTAVPKVNSILASNPNTTYNIISLMGVNFLLSDINNYIARYNQLATNEWKNHNIILVSVNPVNEQTEAKYGYRTKNTDIESFNTRLKNGTNSNSSITYCDTYNQIKNNFYSGDGLHYNNATYQNIYNLILKCI